MMRNNPTRGPQQPICRQAHTATLEEVHATLEFLPLENATRISCLASKKREPLSLQRAQQVPTPLFVSIMEGKTTPAAFYITSYISPLKNSEVRH